jgi:YidC/Oxa1 family membrane protein insertase
MEQRNLIYMLIAFVVIFMAYQHFFAVPPRPVQQAAPQAAQQQAALAPSTGTGAPGASNTPPEATPVKPLDYAAALALSPRVPIATPKLHGSIALKGGRIDDLILADYRETVQPNSPDVHLLSPSRTVDAYFVEFGWVPKDAAVKVPDKDTLWAADGQTLTPGKPLTLSWDNGAGLKFSLIFALDDEYMFTVGQKVENSGTAAVELRPYSRAFRSGTPKGLGFAVLHEGPIGVINDELLTRKSGFFGWLWGIGYSDVKDAPGGNMNFDSKGGWLGFTDKYWLVSLIADQKDTIFAQFHHDVQNTVDQYQASFTGPSASVQPGASVMADSRTFAGPKEVSLLVRYRDQLGIPKFDLAVDFGILWFLTKPIFYFLDFLYGLVGNFGIAIMLLTVAIKLLFLPLANRSYRAMSKMKALGPEMTKLRERFKDDKAKLNQEMMALYKKEKVNPAAGCLPIMVQIPVFFSLYKVLVVTIEMRQKPFFGWIHDLSVPDPTSIVNLFGLAPWQVPDFTAMAHLGGPLSMVGGLMGYISIGVWPIIMGITMYLQQKLNPAPPDPMQARMFMLLPIVFTFMLAHFAAGLVIYWAWNNLLSIAQQRFIMWRMGVKA